MAQPLLLAVETSHRQGSIALGTGDQILAARSLSSDRRHASELLPAIADLLRDTGHNPADIATLAYSAGPGSFTGLRVAATLGSMLQSALGCDVVAVPTLEVIARSALEYQPNATALSAQPTSGMTPPQPRATLRVAVILDARGGRIYAALFELRGSPGDQITTLQPAGAFEPQAWFAQLAPPLWVLGEGLRKHATAAAATGATILPEDLWLPRAENVAIIGARVAKAGQFCRPEQILPQYIRPPECEEVYEKRRAAARRRRGE
jgi:tRNA threonylcarbamoyladenosine biosynthesis protein TsaB